MNNSGTAADTADPDHDGLPNLIEYATGLNPLVPSANPMKVSISGGLLHISVGKNSGAVDAVLDVQSTTTLANPSSWTTNGMVIDQNTSSQLSLHYSTPVASSPTRYLRLEATDLNFTAPSTPPNLTLTTPAGASVTVSWSAPYSGGPTIDSYLIEIYTSGVFDTSVSVLPNVTFYTFTGLTTANYPTGTIGKSYTFYVYAHNSVGYSPAAAGSIVPKVSYLADNLRGIFSKTYAAGSCLACHVSGGPIPNLTPSGTMDYNNAASEGTKIYQVPANQVPGSHTSFLTFGNTSLEYNVLRQWVSDGQLQ